MSEMRRKMMEEEPAVIIGPNGEEIEELEDPVRQELEVKNPGTTLCTILYEDRIFKKYGDGFAICAIANISGYYGPIVVSKDTSQGWSVQVWETIVHRTTTVLNNVYYFTDTNEYFWRNKSDIQFDTFDLNSYTGVVVYDSARAAAQDLLNYYLGVI